MRRGRIIIVILMIVAVGGCFFLHEKKISQKSYVKQVKKEEVEQPKNPTTKIAVQTAKKIYKEHPQYSQPKRMMKGYIDCSAYVWKCYRKAGINFGQEDYAPTAAEIARWCKEDGKLLSLKRVDGKTELLEPGDLIFYSKRIGSNGRYKNINHVAIYIGNGKILHANGDAPEYGEPWYRKVAAVARPAG